MTESGLEWKSEKYVKIDAVLQIFLKQNEVLIGFYPKSCREAYFVFCILVTCSLHKP